MILKINKNYLGDECSTCKSLAESANITQERLDDLHEDCHGWYHCEPECCGGCIYCGG